LGTTRGFGKCNRRYWQHGKPKLVFVRPLVPDAASRLLAPFLSPLHANRKENPWMIDVNCLPR
jgi:hypothetical protein